MGIVTTHRVGRFWTDVGHAIECRLSSASADREVARAVVPDHSVGQWQRPTRNEFLLLADVAGSLRLQMDGVDRAEGPIQQVDRPLVFGGKPGAPAKLDPHRGTGSDVDDLRQTVNVIGGPLAGAAAPTEIAAAGGVDQPSGAVPGHPHVPLHVGVVSEDLTVGVEIKVVRVAIADADDFPPLGVRVCPGNPSSRRQTAPGMAAGVPLTWKQKILRPVRRHAAGLQTLRWIGVVDGDHIQRHAIGRQTNPVRPVFAATAKASQFLQLVVLIVAIGVSCPIKTTSRAAVHRKIEAVKGRQHALCRRDIEIEPLDARRLGRANRRGRDAIDARLSLGRKFNWQPNLALSINRNIDFLFQRDGMLENLGNTNIAYSPGVIVGSILSYMPTEELQISLLTKYVGEQYMGNIDSEVSKLDDYSQTDLNVQYAINTNGFMKRIIISGLVNNLFDAEFVSNGYFFTFDDDFSNPGTVTTIEGAGFYPQAGINFLLGATFEF